jgi:predicted transcriptional regulator
MNKIKNGVTEIERARIIKRTLGVSVAARYLRNRNWSVEAARFILLNQ